MNCVLCHKDNIPNERKYPICLDCICDELFCKPSLAKWLKLKEDNSNPKPKPVEVLTI